MTETEIVKVVGRAGSGKTSFLMKELMSLLQQGIPASKIGLITFTKSAAEVFKQRAINAFSLNTHEADGFRTMHSHCYKLLDLKTSNVMKYEDIVEFRNKYFPHYRIREELSEDVKASETERENFTTAPLFRVMWDICQRARSCRIREINEKSLRELEILTGQLLFYDNPIVEGYKITSDGYIKIKWGKEKRIVNSKELEKFRQSLMEYMKQHDLYDFTRMLEEVLELQITPNYQYLFFDEFQDFSKLEFDIYRLFTTSKKAKKVWIAGDDAQTIYRWSGASSNFLINEPANYVIELRKSYRFGKAIAEESNLYLDRLKEVYPLQTEAVTKRKSVVEEYYHLSDDWKSKVNLDDKSKSFLILAPTNYLARKIKDDLSKIYPDVRIAAISDRRKLDRVLNMYNAIAALERGEEVEWKDIKELFTGSKSLSSKIMIIKEQTTLDNYNRSYEKKTILKPVKSKISRGEFEARTLYDRESFEKDFLKIEWDGWLLVNAIPDIEILGDIELEFPNYISAKDRVRYGTIHRAKGDEADVVILAMATPKIYIENKNDLLKDDLLRLFYVGTTRAKERLIKIYGYAKTHSRDVIPPLVAVDRVPEKDLYTSKA